MNQIQSLEEQLIAQEWDRLMVELKKASEIVKNALRRYENEEIAGGEALSIQNALAGVVTDAVYRSVDSRYRSSLVVSQGAIIPTSIPDVLRPLLLSVASRELLESLRNVPVLMDQVSDLEGRQE